MIQIYQRMVKDRKMRTLEKYHIGSWVYVENPSPEELESLSSELSLDNGLLLDGIDPYEVPRLEVKDGTLYVFARVPHETGEETVTSPVLFVIHEHYLVTVSLRELSFFTPFRKGEEDLHTTQRTKLFLQMFASVNRVYRKSMTRMNRDVRSAGVRLEEIRNKDIIQFVRFETSLNDFLSSLVPAQNVLTNLLSGNLLKLYEEDRDLVEDLSLTTSELIEFSKSNLKTIVNIREAYSTIMTNNLNRVIKLFTSVTVLLTIPTMIASLYGMNVNLPFADSPHAFFWIIIFTSGISFALILLFARNRWL
ncbi:MAG: magnesium transporter CorA family protein [Nanoarchaeota archaeon]|nr:magnesium transporter CorA family protein [Nanoarchaeota archaeon]